MAHSSVPLFPYGHLMHKLSVWSEITTIGIAIHIPWCAPVQRESGKSLFLTLVQIRVINLQSAQSTAIGSITRIQWLAQQNIHHAPHQSSPNLITPGTIHNGCTTVRIFNHGAHQFQFMKCMPVHGAQDCHTYKWQKSLLHMCKNKVLLTLNFYPSLNTHIHHHGDIK